MACVYILYSPSLDMFYTGSCKELETRLQEHNNKIRIKSFTAKANDWEVYFVFENLEYKQARSIENHIKRMKSRAFIENIKKYPELTTRLVKMYK